MAQSDVDYTLAEINVRYHQRIQFPARLEVGARVSSVGRKHFVMEYQVASSEGEVLVSGESTQVMLDYDSGATVPILQEVRPAIEAWEPGLKGLPREHHGTSCGL